MLPKFVRTKTWIVDAHWISLRTLPPASAFGHFSHKDPAGSSTEHMKSDQHSLVILGFPVDNQF